MTINGIGERAGNAALEEVVVVLRVRQATIGVTTNIHLDKLYATSRLLTEITGVPVAPNKAVVGANAFAHEAGIHQDGILKNPLTYEIISPEAVGVPKRSTGSRKTFRPQCAPRGAGRNRLRSHARGTRRNVTGAFPRWPMNPRMSARATCSPSRTR